LLENKWKKHNDKKPRNAPTVISTFAGCGGSSLGYSMAGFRELLAIEWDDNAVETFKTNFPDVPVYHGDIAKISVDDILRTTGLKQGELDIFDGSPPCQGFSTAGKRDVEDSRNQLFREFVRLLRGLQPKVLVMENVSGMVKGKMKIIFAEIMRELKASGYNVSCRLLNAKYFEVPQSRERLIFIGVREDLEIEPSHPLPLGKTLITPRQAFINCIDNDFRLLSPWLKQAAKYIDAGNYNHQSVEKAFVKVKGKTSGSINTKMLSWGRVSCTLTKSEIGETGIIHPDGERYLSICEMKRIGSFPDEFKFVGDRKQKIARIGNSVPPLFMYHIAKHIRENILSRITE
jgi:DNA (cytosine-5)-methyltransferase 1